MRPSGIPRTAISRNFFNPKRYTSPVAGKARIKPMMENTDMIQPYDDPGMLSAWMISTEIVAGLNMFRGAAIATIQTAISIAHAPFGTASLTGFAALPLVISIQIPFQSNEADSGKRRSSVRFRTQRLSRAPLRGGKLSPAGSAYQSARSVQRAAVLAQSPWNDLFALSGSLAFSAAGTRITAHGFS